MLRSTSYLRFALLLGLLALAALTASCAEAGSQTGDDDDVVKIDSGSPPNSDGGGGGCDSCDTKTSNGCSDNRCVCNLGPACGDGSTCCPLGCRNLDSDPSNCGMCGRPCGPNETCTAGECVCSATGTDCGALDCCASVGCVDTSSDNDHCGNCTTTCDAGDVCSGGSCNCAFTCPTPLPIDSNVVCCSDGCYDTCTDVDHCGGCDATTCATCDLGGCSDADGNAITPPDLFNCLPF